MEEVTLLEAIQRANAELLQAANNLQTAVKEFTDYISKQPQENTKQPTTPANVETRAVPPAPRRPFRGESGEEGGEAWGREKGNGGERGDGESVKRMGVIGHIGIGREDLIRWGLI